VESDMAEEQLGAVKVDLVRNAQWAHLRFPDPADFLPDPV
jgi:hypothetical protein